MILETILVGPLETNCYVLATKADSRAVIIDPGAEECKIKKILDKHKLRPEAVINTHGHIDHIGCDDKFGVAVYIHKLDAPLLENPELNLSSFLSMPFTISSDIHTLEQGDKIELGGLSFEVIHVPGHTPGGIALLLADSGNKILFSGDSLFCGSIGRTDFKGGDNELLVKSVKEKLLVLPDDTLVYPGHGSSTTIGEEKRENPYL